MPKVVGIKFNKTPKVYYFEAKDFEYEIGAGVIVETSKDLEFGTVAMLPTEIDETKIVTPLKPVIRLATEKDLAKLEAFENKKEEIFNTCSEIIEKSGLNMKLVDIEQTFDESKIIVHFSADARVDFRELVKKLASVFRKRIELRQIGARDECRILGGMGCCGRACCCNSHLHEYPHVTIKMAKNQNLSLNPSKISGLCGRLLCCLEYENAHYAETNKRMPKLGSQVLTADNREGIVIGVNQIKETVKLKISEKDVFIYSDFPLSEIIMPKKKNGQVITAEPEIEDSFEDSFEDSDSLEIVQGIED